MTNLVFFYRKLMANGIVFVIRINVFVGVSTVFFFCSLAIRMIFIVRSSNFAVNLMHTRR